MSKFFSGVTSSIKQKVGGLFSSKKQEGKDKENVKPLQTESVLKQQQTSLPMSSMTYAQTQPAQSKKAFNIQLSEDDKDVYNLNPGEDDDEEEEYEIDEQTPTPSSKDEKTVTPQPIDSQKPLEDQEPLSTRSESIPVYIEQKEDSASKQKKFKDDPSTFCHRLRKKSSLFSLDEVEYYQTHKLKEKETLLSSFGFVDSKMIKKEYITFFEEGFIYFSKDIALEKKPTMRKLGNRYPLKNITNIFYEKDSKAFMLIHLEFTNDDGFGLIQKEFYLDIALIETFIDDLQQRLKLVGIDCVTNEEQEHTPHEESQNEPSREPMPMEIQLMGE